jgi:hypothetical protein
MLLVREKMRKKRTLFTVFFCRYAPQDADELKVALVDLIEAVDVFCEALLNVDSSEGCRKVKSVSQTLCKDALTKIEDAIARDKSKKK